MGTKLFSDVDLWIDDEELDELAQSLERIVRSSPRPHPGPRQTFFTDYYEAE